MQGVQKSLWVRSPQRIPLPKNINPIIFSQLCSFYHQGKLASSQTEVANQNLGHIKVNTSKISSEVKRKDPGLGSESTLGRVWVGNTHEAICILANSMKVVWDRTDVITQQLSCMVEPRVCNNLPLGLVVNRTMVSPNRHKKVPIALVNTNTYNIWIRQPLLAADIVKVKHYPWDYQTIMSHESDDVQVLFCPVPTSEIQAEIMAASVVEISKTKKAKATSKESKNKE